MGAAFEGRTGGKYGSLGPLSAYGMEVSEASDRLRRALLGGPGAAGTFRNSGRPPTSPPPSSYAGLLTPARAEGAPLDVGEQREYHRKHRSEAHVAEQYRRLLTQRVDDPFARGAGDHVEVQRGDAAAAKPSAGRPQSRETA